MFALTRYWHSIFFLMFVSLFSTSVHAESKTITLVADYWPPYNGTPGAVHEGYMVTLVRLVFEPLGYQVTYKMLPWKRAIIETRKGRFNAVIGATRKETPDFIFPEQEAGISYLSFFVNKRSQWRYQHPGSLSTVYLGAIDGYDYNDWFLDYLDANPDRVYLRYGYAPLRDNLSLLVNGRLDAVAGDVKAVRWIANELAVSNQIQHAGKDTSVAAQRIYHAFSPAKKSSAKYAELLSQGIESLRQSGELQKLMKAYQLQDWRD